MKKDKVSSAVIRRLPRYYRHLNDLYLAGVERISSNALGRSMGLTASQIRQDLSCFGEFGQQGYGYNVENLRGEISEILGMKRGHTAVVVGAGNLGRALIENFHFDRSGVAAADERRRMTREPSGDFPRVMIDAAFFSGSAVTCFHCRAERADVLSAVSRQIRFRYEIAGDFPDAPRPGEKRKALQLPPEIMEHVRRCHRKGPCFMVFQRFYYKI